MKQGRIFFVLVIGFVFIYLIYSMVDFGSGNSGRQVDSIRQIIDKAMIQCYALEGSYPTSVEHIENYGVILDHDRYIYHFEWFATNMKPTVIVIER